jgi:hypothetical protein
MEQEENNLPACSYKKWNRKRITYVHVLVRNGTGRE